MSLTVLAKFIQDIQVLNPMSVSLFLPHSTPINIWWSQALLPSWTPLAYRVQDAVFLNRHHFLWVLCQLLIFYLSSRWESLRPAFWAPHSLRVSGAHLASKAASPQIDAPKFKCSSHSHCVFHRLTMFNCLEIFTCKSCCAVFSHVQLCATPWTAACQASLSMGILQARILQ